MLFIDALSTDLYSLLMRSEWNERTRRLTAGSPSTIYLARSRRTRPCRAVIISERVRRRNPVQPRRAPPEGVVFGDGGRERGSVGGFSRAGGFAEPFPSPSCVIGRLCSRPLHLHLPRVPVPHFIAHLSRYDPSPGQSHCLSSVILFVSMSVACFASSPFIAFPNGSGTESRIGS